MMSLPCNDMLVSKRCMCFSSTCVSSKWNGESCDDDVLMSVFPRPMLGDTYILALQTAIGNVISNNRTLHLYKSTMKAQWRYFAGTTYLPSTLRVQWQDDAVASIVVRTQAQLLTTQLPSFASLHVWCVEFNRGCHMLHIITWLVIDGEASRGHLDA